MITIDFSALETKLVLEGLITQTILPFSDRNKELKKGDICQLSFESLIMKNYFVQINHISVTSLEKLSNQDLFNQGFLYRPFFSDFMKEKGYSENETILKIDFKIIEK